MTEVTEVIVDQERVKLLTDALRSDRFKQGRGTLARRRRDGQIEHCCLGVACEIARENGLELAVDWHRNNPDGDIAEYQDQQGNSSMGGLPRGVLDWYGFSDPPRVLVQRVTDDLDVSGLIEHMAYYANDRMRLTFDQIAAGFDRKYLTTESLEVPEPSEVPETPEVPETLETPK